MKNTKRNLKAKNDLTKFEALKRLMTFKQFKFTFRQFLAAFFIYALVFVPLLTADSAVQKAYGQVIELGCSSEPSADFIFQKCAFGAYGKTLENQAIGDVIQFYKLPDTSAERARVKSFARNEVRGFLFTRMIALFKKPNPTAEEQDGINAFLRLMKGRRVLAAQAAIDEYNKWKQTACTGYQPPAPYTYQRSSSCYGIGGYFSSVKPPSFEEFQQFGAVIAYGDLVTPQAQDVATQTTIAIGVGVGAGLATVGGAVGAAVGATITFSALSAILPFAAASNTVLTLSGAGVFGAQTAAFAASTSSGAVGATALAGPAAIIIIALTAAVMEGISVRNASRLPGKLQDALTRAHNDNFNQFSFTYDDVSMQQIYSEFLAATLPDFPGSGVPPVSANDRQFSVRFNNSTEYQTASSIVYVDWENICHEVRFSGGWFVDKNTVTGVQKQTLSIKYIDWNNKPRIASRNGAKFLLTDAGNVNGSTLADELEYKSCGGTYLGAKVKYEQFTYVPNSRVTFDCSIDNSADNSINRVFGKVAGSLDAPSALIVSVNNATSATVNGITVFGLYVNSNYEVVGKIKSASVPVPSQPSEFTIKVSNAVGSATGTSTLTKSAIQDKLSGLTDIDVMVGSYVLRTSQFNGTSTCGFNDTVSLSGAVPPGLTLFSDSNRTQISGTPTSGGKYTINAVQTYTNGETFKRSFVVNVRSELTRAANGLTSWWRAENNADDFNNVHNGTMRGAASFTDGFVGRSFSFNGANGYVELPTDTFEPSQTFTFETWFRTGASGTILGQQAGIPYQTDLANQLINVTSEGYLRALMWGGNEIVSTAKVNDNQYHHLAVTYNSVNKNRELYLDGKLVGTANGVSYRLTDAQYQFGTGTVRNAAQYSNFNGIIDEPALYNAVLTPEEVASLYRSGGAGKITLEIAAVPTLDNTGILRITVRGGARGFQYSIDNGVNFSTTSEFINLTAKSYNVVVKDGEGRLFRTTATVPNASPGFNVTATATNPKCSGAANGKVTINPGTTVVSGTSVNDPGAVPVIYSLNNGATTQSSNVFTGVSAGTYTPWVKHEASGTIGRGAPITLVNPPPLALNPTNFVNSAAVGFSYNQEFQVINGTVPINVAVSQMPPGLTAYLDNEGLSGHFRIGGTPTQTGTFPITVTATDGNSCPLTQTLSLTVNDGNCRVVTVQNNNDTGAGSLRQTIADACPEARIRIPGSIGRITLNSQILIDKTLNIEADNPNLNVISGNNQTRIFETGANTIVNVSNVTLTGGNAGNAGAGAIANRGTLTIFNSVLDGNRALSGGAIYNVGAVYLSNSSVINNFASGNSGGIFNGDGRTLKLRNATVAGNSTNGAGGGIFNGGTLLMANSTVTGNRSGADGNGTGGNGTGGGGLAASGTETLINSIIAGNLNGTTAASTANDLSSTVETADYNLIGNAATAGGIANGATGNIVGNNGAGTIPIASILNPMLSLNGGSTPSFALAANSPAIDKGKLYDDNTRFGASDQRFRTRPVDNPDVPNAAGGNGSDIGSFEVQAAPNANSLSISGRITNGGQGLSNVLVLLSNSKTATTYTDAGGNYTFNELPNNGFFDITPTLNGYTFNSPTLSYSNVTANVTRADFITSAVTYEGDIAVRPTGNGTIDVFDLVTLGRIIGTLDAKPANGGEFQRSDVAPAISFGDGAINVLDLVQVGRYAGYLDQKTPATGAAFNSVSSSAANGNMFSSGVENPFAFGGESPIFDGILFDNRLKDNSASPVTPNAPAAANLSAGSVNATATNAVVPINLTSNADTAAIQFTVNYDTAKLSIPMDANNSAIINRYPNTTFVINNNTPGKLGIVAYQPLDGVSTFPNSAIKLFDINFSVVNGARGTTAVGFGNDPIPQTASNPQAGAVSIASAPGTVTFMAPTAANVTIGGRVIIGERGLINATVNLTDQNGETRQARTTLSGYYRFTEVAAGKTYVVSVISKKYSFSPQAINVTEDIDNLNFTASERNRTAATSSP